MKVIRFLSNKYKVDLLTKFNKALKWVKVNSITGKGIKVTAQSKEVYPEVTGYFIPTLINWGERELALQYANWLKSIQKPDGSWFDPFGKNPYTFDTGQILKGLLALLEHSPNFKEPIIKGCDWIMSQILESGQVITPDASAWRLPGGRVVPEAIHLYALEPLRMAGNIWGIRDYSNAVDRAINYYLKEVNLTRFDTLSHFHAYIIEALIDLGCTEYAQSTMQEVAKYQTKSGKVPSYPDEKWVCSTGLFQYALIWYKLGIFDRAEKAFNYACGLQNASGGFFGSYGRRANYFPREEISWAIKYFLDCFYWKVRSSFNDEVSTFSDELYYSDGRYQFITEKISQNKLTRVLDMGCGKGRYIKRLKSAFPGIEAYGMDISEKMLETLPKNIYAFQGTLLNMPFPDGYFDSAFCVETLEHAVNIPSAIREMGRVISKGGFLIIIDKNKEKQGKLKISEWEQWFTENQVAELLKNQGFDVEVYSGIGYEQNDGSDQLFLGWVAKKL
ncbi:methyltransferase domain-containing protein [Phosphitispora sp. TUW77]|uniref:methyltransferase domain-containing protein n=1 Tax=Phosphitispora sp. TUW77 TaxID=3152361 RepID=UPI003AB695D0